MKYLFFLFITAYLTCQVTGCTEEELPYRPPDLSTPDVSVPVVVEADAGSDVLVELPGNEATLNGSTNAWDPNIKEYYWTKISGPNSFLIVSRYALQTKLLELEKGVYEFEFTVTNVNGMTGKDTAMVTVGALTQNPSELIFNDQSPDQFWDYGVFVIGNFYAHIPRGSFFKVFVRRDNSAAWEEAMQALTSANNDPYSFTVWSDCLWVWTSSDLNDKSEVKITYD